MNNRGEVTLLVLLILAAIGGGGFALSKTKWFHGDSRRAKASTEATAKVELATAKVDAAVQHQGAVAAASLVKIGEAAASAPASPEREFQMREVPLALSYLPKPDAEALLAAEQRKVAVMQGQLSEVSRLYGDANKRSQQLEQEKAQALAARAAEQAKREAVDRELSEVAAARLAAEQQRMVWIAVALLLLAGWGYTKFYSIGTGTLGKIAADVRGGEPAIAVMDRYLAPWMHPLVQKAAKLATDLDKDGNGTSDAAEIKTTP